jgi:hypothetical protein
MMTKKHQENEELDRLGGRILRAAAQTETETDAIADSPFLFTRVRARIDEEQRRRDEAGGWLSLLFVARRAVPAMALIAFLAAVLTFWSSQPSGPPAWNRLDDEALSDTRDPGVEQTILSRNSLSPDEILSIVVDRSERERP